MSDNDSKEYIKHTTTEKRVLALNWAEGKTDAQLLDALVEQRNIVEDITREAEEKAAAHKAWDTALTDELLRRMAESGVKSFKIEGLGIATLIPRRVFSIEDPQKLYDFVVATGSISIFGSALKKAEVESYEADNNALPDGVTSHVTNTIRITRKK